MKLSDAGAALLEGFEGFRSHPYQDIVGVYTIGFGSTKGVGPNTPPITRTEARARMKSEVDATYGAAVERALTREPNQHQFDAMVSLAYNIGTGGFAGSTVVREFNRGNVGKAAQAFMLWVKAGGQTIEGLVRRRRSEMALFQRAVVVPVAYSDKERYLMRVSTAKGIAPRRRARARDWLLAQQGEIARRARRDGWDEADRSRRFRGLRKLLGIGRPR